jgi:hypothetical protein
VRDFDVAKSGDFGGHQGKYGITNMFKEPLVRR